MPHETLVDHAAWTSWDLIQARNWRIAVCHWNGIGTETAADVFTVIGQGVASRHAWVWIDEVGMQAESLAGETFVNGHAIHERIQVEYPATVQVGDLTLVV